MTDQQVLENKKKRWFLEQKIFKEYGTDVLQDNDMTEKYSII